MEIPLNIEKIQYTDEKYPPYSNHIPDSEQLQEIIMEGKKRARTERYENCTQPLDLELFYELKHYKLLSFLSEPSETHGSNGRNRPSTTYKDSLVWNIQALNEIPLNKDIDRNKLIQFLIPKKDITYEEAEELLSDNPNTLVAAMTILQNSYEWATIDLRTETYNRQNRKNADELWEPKYLFTPKEEIIFLTGKTLLEQLNKTYQSEYVKELIKESNGIICEFNRGLIGTVARKYQHLQPTLELFQEGNLGLLRALKTFDIDRNLKFSTYATWWIRRHVRRFCANNRSIIRHPVYLNNDLNRLLLAKAEKEREEGAVMNIEEAIEYSREIGVQLKSKDKNLINAYNQRGALSLDKELERPEGNSSSNMLSYLMDESVDIMKTINEREQKELVEKIIDLANLNPREEKILRLRFDLTSNKGKPNKEIYTLEELGVMYDISRERVRQIESVAKRKARRAAQILRNEIGDIEFWLSE